MPFQASILLSVLALFNALIVELDIELVARENTVSSKFNPAPAVKVPP